MIPPALRRLPDGSGRGGWAVVVVVVLAVVGCSNADLLPVLRDEPLLAAPAAAVELARTEQDGTTLLFGTPARVEVLWGVVDARQTSRGYLQVLGDTYDLRRNQDDQWLGGRTTAGQRVNISVRAWDGLDDVRWATMVTTEDAVAPWGGEVVSVSASSS